jgi:hypothetical protein
MSMTIVSLMKLVAFGLPLCGALIIWLWRGRRPRAQRLLTFALLGLAGLAGLTLFVLNAHYACIFAPGSQNCLFDGLATLSLCLLGIMFAFRALRMHAGDHHPDYILMLALISGWAAAGLAENLFELLVGVNMIGYVVYRWLKHSQVHWGFVIDFSDRHNDSR